MINQRQQPTQIESSVTDCVCVCCNQYVKAQQTIE